MSRNFADVPTESRLLDEVAQRRQRLSARRTSVTPQMAGLFNSYADAYPWMDPTAIQSLVQAGLSPDLAQVQSIGEMAARQAAEDGQLADPGDDVPDAWYEILFNAATGWAKPVVRTGFTVLATPFEEIQALLTAAGVALFDETEAGKFGLLDDLGGNLAAVAGEIAQPDKLLRDFWTNYTTKAARSSGVLALGDLLSGKGVDLGAGFLPTGAIFEEREAAKRRLQLDGQFMTIGRLVARQFTEPGSLQYQIVSGLNDLAANIFLDPAFIATAGLSKGAKAARAFQATGMLSGIRKTVLPERAVQHYLTSPVGQRTVRWLTENRSVEAAWKATGRADLGVAKRLAATSDEAATFGVLTDVLGTVIREKPTASFVSRGVGRLGGNEYGRLFGGGARVRQSVDNTRIGALGRLGRLGGDMPAQTVNIWDPDDAARQLDLWMRNATLPQEMRAARIAQMADLNPGDEVGMFNALRGIMDDTQGFLVNEWGLSKSRARKLTRLYEDLSDDLRTFDLEDVGRNVDVLRPLRVNVEGKTIDVTPLPGMISELAETIPLPDARAIRRLTPTVRQMQRLFDSGLWKGSIDGLEALMSNIWKPFQLLRFAYPTRVIGEEQFRMAASGYDSMFRHPISGIAWSLSVDPKSKLGRKLAEAAKKVVDPKGTSTATGALWDDIAEHGNALNRGSAGWRGLPGEVVTGRFVKARKGQEGFYRGWAVELAHESNDPVMRRVAGGLTSGDLRTIGREASSGSVFDDVAEWFWSGTGQTWRKKLGAIEGRSAMLTDRAAADGYLRQNYFDRLGRMTGGDPDLVELVAKGRLGDINLRGFNHEKGLARILEDTYESAAPGFVKMEEVISGSTPGSRTLGRLDRATERAFEGLMSRPTNYLSRSPTFRQKYWQRAEEVIGFADRPTQEALIRNARKANIGDDAITRMASTVLKGEGSKLSSLDDIDTLAKAFALDETKKLLYDLTKRNQFFDVMRVVFPFGEAWKEIIGAWTKIIRQNPQTIRRFQQGMEGLRQPSVFGEPETTPGSGEGFFHPDPQTGEEVFTYPGGRWVSKLLLGTDKAGFEFVGRAAGLNIFTATILPGFGPVIQVPASKLIPQTPKWDDVREILLPFGEAQGIIDSFTPAWLDKIKEVFAEPDPDQYRLFNNTVIDVQRALLRGGDYDISTVEAQQEMFDAAVTKARILYVIRGAAQSTVPTGPSLQWTTTDLAGNVVPVKLLADELRRSTEEDYGGDRQAAFTEWVRRFGVDNVLAVVGKSTALVERPVTEKGDAWLRAHPDEERTYPLTIGFFAPEPAVGDFDYTAYLRAFATGAREGLSPAEQIDLANNFLGRVQWEQAKRIAAFRPGPVTATWLAQVRDQIASDYPGFDGWVAAKVVRNRPTTDQMITELRKAVTAPAIAATDAGQGTILYLSAIAIAEQMVLALPGNVRRYQQAKAAAPIRAFLRSVARQIIADHPDFARVWFRVFERELADDQEGFF